MAFAGKFTISQTSDPSVIKLTDTSVGSDGTITGRTVRLYRADGTLFSGPTAWAIGDATVTLAILEKDIALNVVVDWLVPSPGAGNTYVFSQIFAFIMYGEYMAYKLTQLQTSNPAVITDTDYRTNKMRLRVDLDSAVNAINFGADLYAAQTCIDDYNFMILNQKNFF